MYYWEPAEPKCHIFVQTTQKKPTIFGAKTSDLLHKKQVLFPWKGQTTTSQKAHEGPKYFYVNLNKFVLISLSLHIFKTNSNEHSAYCWDTSHQLANWLKY